MNKPAYQEFLKSDETLRVYDDSTMVFSSKKEGLRALIEYIGMFAGDYRGVIILDKVAGNAAALLAIKAGCQELHSPLGSSLAVSTLNQYGIRHYFGNIVPYIQQQTGNDMCPMERLSINQGPEEFYSTIKARING